VVGARSYRFRELLGEGAFGAVYRAEVVGAGLQRDVAIKVLHRERAASPAIVRRLRDEARMLAMIRHRAIVRVDDLVELGGDWSIVMEYVEGCDVATLLAAGPLPGRVALAIAEEAANALHSAWQQPGPDGARLRLVHRDIKPSNLRLTAQGELKLLDFGVARADFAAREAGTTQTGFGTLAYMAAERFEGRDSHAGDIYALGVSLFEMLTGVPPGQTAADKDRQPPGSRLTAEWAAIGGIAAELQVLLARMLAYEAEERPTGRDCAAALEHLRGQLGGERLEDWSARVVPRVMAEARSVREGAGAGPRTGSIVSAGSPGAAPAAGPTATPPRPITRAVPWLAGGAITLVLAVAAIVAGGAAWWAFGPGAAAPTSGAGPAVVGGLPVVGSAAADPSAVDGRPGVGGPAGDGLAGAPAADGGPGVGGPAGGGAAGDGAAGAPAADGRLVVGGPAGGLGADGSPVPSPSGTPGTSDGSGAAPAPATRLASAATPDRPTTPPATRTAAPDRPATPPATRATPDRPTTPPPATPTGDGAPAAAGKTVAATTPGPSPAPAATTTGTLLLAGDPVTVTLSGPAGHVRPGAVPPGVYTAEVTFTSGATVVVRDIAVTAGHTTRLTCNADFSNCRPQVD
jgi:serine/threonine-protein kinase